jgi:CRISPR-associated RAMP protein (TIGR02581 family)
MSIFERRYVFTGQIMLHTALHIGGGSGTLSVSDSPIVRTPEGRPFVPGSSFKGAFRSTVEKLAGALSTVRTCALTDGAGCPGPQGESQREFNWRRRDERWDEAKLIQELMAALCDTCKLFGSPFAVSKLQFSDLYLAAGEDPVMQVRDGVGIDRDSERAVEHIKFDFEVVEANTAFDTELTLDDPTATDLGLTCLGLCEYLAGFGGLGGKRSRGLGGCRLINLTVYELDLTNEQTRAQRLRDYLLGREDAGRRLAALTVADRMMPIDDVEGFLRQHVDRLFEARSA